MKDAEYEELLPLFEARALHIVSSRLRSQAVQQRSYNHPMEMSRCLLSKHRLVKYSVKQASIPGNAAEELQLSKGAELLPPRETLRHHFCDDRLRTG